MAEWTQWTTWFYGWAMERLPLLLDLSIRLGFILLLAWAWLKEPLSRRALAGVAPPQQSREQDERAKRPVKLHRTQPRGGGKPR